MSTKHRIRGYKRLLQKKTIPDEMRVSLTKKLRDLEAKVQSTNSVKRMHRDLKFSRTIRFVEQQKLKRREKQAKKRLAKATDNNEIASAKAELVAIYEKIKYVEIFPKDEKYIPIMRDENARKSAAKSSRQQAILKKARAYLARSSAVPEAKEELSPSLASDKGHLSDDFFLAAGQPAQAALGEEKTSVASAKKRKKTSEEVDATATSAKKRKKKKRKKNAVDVAGDKKTVTDEGQPSAASTTTGAKSIGEADAATTSAKKRKKKKRKKNAVGVAGDKKVSVDEAATPAKTGGKSNGESDMTTTSIKKKKKKKKRNKIKDISLSKGGNK